MSVLIRWGVKSAIFATLALAVTLTVMAIRSEPAPHHPITDTPGVLAIAHRGGRGLWPENTMYAFENAIRMGVDVLEFDVHLTKDGKLVVIHDDRVDRTTEATGRVEEMTFDTLSRLDAGYRWTADNGGTFPFRGQNIRIPAFEEVLERFPEKRINIELKTEGTAAAEQFTQVLKRYTRTDRTLIASFNQSSIDYLQNTLPGPAYAVTGRNAFFFLVLHLFRVDFAFSATQHAFQVPAHLAGFTVVTPRFVKRAHAHNMAVHAWTINDSVEMKRLIDAGVDGIMTDYPDRLLDVLGRPLPE
ncbi:MAG: glycerophosphodiester phosphodiesterase [candidate division Zixibacteria bacterium]|nr:glycerophosphodiester phosphodiesterase [candidate division Zixibacteria bacterium]